ncbi:MAG: right-handed parallel beta-helix repeat-containing protein, partial [Dehalococcoidia bacterium]|nr:right-handed parallel beta-helix repeat-containing protein [Dehalococcoidia bacterium]
AYITFNNSTTGRLRHCVIQYAGSSTGGAPKHFSLGVGAPTDVEVRHCTIEHGRGVGVLVQETATSPLLDNVTIRNVSDVAIYHQNSPLPTLRYSNLTLTNNGTNAVELPDSATVNKPVTLDSAALGGAFFLAGSIAINANQTLTITPGTTLRFKNDAYLVAAPNGRLVAEGTPSQPITFTSALTTPAPGSWAFITFNANATGRLRHCVIQYAGSSTG